jgi:hypothetical protein
MNLTGRMGRIGWLLGPQKLWLQFRARTTAADNTMVHNLVASCHAHMPMVGSRCSNNQQPIGNSREPLQTTVDSPLTASGCGHSDGARGRRLRSPCPPRALRWGSCPRSMAQAPWWCGSGRAWCLAGLPSRSSPSPASLLTGLLRLQIHSACGHARVSTWLLLDWQLVCSLHCSDGCCKQFIVCVPARHAQCVG